MTLATAIPVTVPSVSAPSVPDVTPTPDQAVSPEKSDTSATSETMADNSDFEQHLSESLDHSEPAAQDADDPMPMAPQPSQSQQPADALDGDDDDGAIKPKLPKRELDPQVANVLREEAEREKRARLAAQSQTQDEMSLTSAQDDTADYITGIHPQTAIEHDDTELDDIAVSTEPKCKKIYPPNLDDLDDLYNQTSDSADQAISDTLPDPDDLKSSLHDSGDDVTILGVADPAEGAKEKSNRRSGFILAFIVLAAGFWLYSNAAAVAQAIPQTKTALQIFVLSVDAVRNGLNNFATSIITTVSGWLA